LGVTDQRDVDSKDKQGVRRSEFFSLGTACHKIHTDTLQSTGERGNGDLPSLNQLPLLFEKISRKWLSEWVSKHESHFKSDHLDDTRFHRQSEVVHFHSEAFVAVVKVLRIRQQQCTGIVFMHASADS
jgi:hypothetical protein